MCVCVCAFPAPLYRRWSSRLRCGKLDYRTLRISVPVPNRPFYAKGWSQTQHQLLPLLPSTPPWTCGMQVCCGENNTAGAADLAVPVGAVCGIEAGEGGR